MFTLLLERYVFDKVQKKIRLKGIIFIFSLFMVQVAQAKPMGDKNLLMAPHAEFMSEEVDSSLFEGIVAVPGCSGSLVHFKGQPLNQPAVILTNDHCVEDQAYNEYTTNKIFIMRVNIYNKNREVIRGELYTSKILYAVQTQTDMAFLALNKTYEEIYDQYGIRPFELMESGLEAQSAISVISGYWNKVYSCNIVDIVYKIKESTWYWSESYGYFCNTVGGTSGSPIIEEGTRNVVGVNNTGYEGGEACTLNNPCEMDEENNVQVFTDKNYGQQTKYIYSCLSEDFSIDLNKAGCRLYGGVDYNQYY
ncbi:MAG: trypsin-like peptidase domain-containing protein [Bdellovibrionales bacterium]|nr:trypsin-like peptidase domain-containing protein [Bdellovibrionales bacterium]